MDYSGTLYKKYTLSKLISTLENEDVREKLNKRSNYYIYGSQENLFGNNDFYNILDEIKGLLQDGKSLYKKGTIFVKDKERETNVPKFELEVFLRDYLIPIIRDWKIHDCCYGGVEGYKPVDSLKKHGASSAFFSFDLKDAFGNASIDKVFGLFYSNLENFELGSLREDVAMMLAMLCTVKNDKGRGLPIGSPASMDLFNRILYSLDEAIEERANTRNFIYTRWVDDMILSSLNSENTVEDFLGAIDLTEMFFPVAKEKTFFQKGRPVYLLGHEIGYNEFFGISEESIFEEEDDDTSFLRWDEEFGWIGANKYKSWID